MQRLYHIYSQCLKTGQLILSTTVDYESRSLSSEMLDHQYAMSSGGYHFLESSYFADFYHSNHTTLVLSLTSFGMQASTPARTVSSTGIPPLIACDGFGSPRIHPYMIQKRKSSRQTPSAVPKKKAKPLTTKEFPASLPRWFTPNWSK
jgi:hypothetical protein